MALTDHKVTILTDINDDPKQAGDVTGKGANGGFMSRALNAVIDAVVALPTSTSAPAQVIQVAQRIINPQADAGYTIALKIPIKCKLISLNWEIADNASVELEVNFNGNILTLNTTDNGEQYFGIPTTFPIANVGAFLGVSVLSASNCSYLNVFANFERVP